MTGLAGRFRHQRTKGNLRPKHTDNEGFTLGIKASLRQGRGSLRKRRLRFSDLEQSGELTPVLQQELFHGGGFRQADRPVVGFCGLTGLPEAMQEVSANGPIRLIMQHSIQVNRVQKGESRCGSVRFRDRGGISSARAEGRRYADQPFVKQCYGRPVGLAAARTLRMYGLNCSFQLKSAGASLRERFAKMALRLFDQRNRPSIRVLLGKRNITAVRPSSRGA